MPRTKTLLILTLAVLSFGAGWATRDQAAGELPESLVIDHPAKSPQPARRRSRLRLKLVMSRGETLFQREPSAAGSDTYMLTTDSATYTYVTAGDQ